jgi:hypothetical protein
MIEQHSGHRMEPVQGTVRSVRDGQAANLLNPLDYPVTATCRGCGQLIRCDRMMFADWYHDQAPGENEG